MKSRMLFLFFLCLLTASGCFGRKTVQQRYYVIELPASAMIDTVKQPQMAVSCEIEPVEVAPAFAGTRIAVRSDSHEIKYYSYHKWAMRPGDALTQYIESYFRKNRVFAHASSKSWQRMPEYKLQTQVNQLEVVHQDDRLTARVNIEFRLVDNSARDVVVFHSTDERIPLQEKDLNLFAWVVSEIFHKELQIVAEKTATYLRNLAKDMTDKS